MEGTGWFWIAVRALVAIGVTGLCLYFFEKWFAIVINKPAYKQAESKQRNWIELIALTFLCIGFEVAFYWLCKRRSVALEGAIGDETITNFVHQMQMSPKNGLRNTKHLFVITTNLRMIKSNHQLMDNL